MNKNQIRTKVKQIEMMDKEALHEFAITVSTAVGLRSEARDELMEAIRKREKCIANSFDLEVVMSEVKDGELS